MDIDSAAVTDAPISARRLPPPLALHLDLPPPEDTDAPMDVDAAAVGAAAAASSAGLNAMASAGPASVSAATVSTASAVPASVPHSPSVGAGGLGGVTGGSAGGGGGPASVLTSLATAPSVIGFLPPAPGAMLAAGDSDAAPYAKIKLDELFFTWLSRPDIRLLVASLLEDAAAGRPLPPPPQASIHGAVSGGAGGGGGGAHTGGSPSLSPSHGGGGAGGLDATAAGSPPHGAAHAGGGHGHSVSPHGGVSQSAPLYSRGALPLTPSSPVSRFISANVAPPSPRSPARSVFKLAAPPSLSASPSSTPSSTAAGTPKRSSSRTLVADPGSPARVGPAPVPSTAEVALSPAFLGAQVGRTASFDAAALEEAAAAAGVADGGGVGDVAAAPGGLKPDTTPPPSGDDGDARMEHDAPASRGSPASPRRTALDAATVPPVVVSPLLPSAAVGAAAGGAAAATAAADKAATAAAEDAMDSIALHDAAEVGAPASGASSDSDMADVESEGGVASSVDRASTTAVASSMGMPDDGAVLGVPVVDGIDMDDDDGGRAAAAARGAGGDGAVAAVPAAAAARVGGPAGGEGVGTVGGSGGPGKADADTAAAGDRDTSAPATAAAAASAPAESEEMVDDVTLSPAAAVDTVMAGTGAPVAVVAKKDTAAKPPVPRPPASKVAAQAASKVAPALEAGAIPRFYFPCGRDAEDREVRERAAMDKFWNGRRENPDALTDGEVAKLVVEVGGLASFFATLVRTRIIASKEWNPEASDVLTEAAFKRWYEAECAGVARDDRMFRALRGDADRDFVVPSDFKAVLDSLLACHPGLNFLNATPEFQQRYAETVVERIFYGCARTHSGRLTLRDVRTAHLLDTLLLVDEEDDINRERRYFSYEHFYVLYCRFWELDSDHDLLIDRADLQRYGGHALSYRIVDRLFSGAARPLDTARESASAGLMGYTDFVWFCLSEEDKTSDTAIDFWFRCVDLDGDGVVTLFDCEYFYKEQLRRMENLGHEPVSVEDILCQLLDMIRPSVRPPQIRRRDLKSCRLAPAFFNVLFNLNKFFALESRDPVAIRQQHASPELTDWERFAALEYLRLSAEEEDADEEDWDDNTRAAGAIMGEAPF